MGLRAALVGLLLLSVGGVSAAGAAPACDPGPTQADIDACTPEVYAHCDEFIPNRDAITKCLKQKANIISVACRKVVTRPPSKLPSCIPDHASRD